MLYSDFLSFTWSLFYVQCLSQVTTYHLVINSLLDYDSILDFPWFWRPWQFWVLVSYFIKCLSICIFLMFFLMVRLEIYSLERRSVKVKCRFHHLIPSWLITIDADLGHLAVVVLIKILHSNVTSRPTLHSVPYGEKSLCTPHTYGVRSKTRPH